MLTTFNESFTYNVRLILSTLCSEQISRWREQDHFFSRSKDNMIQGQQPWIFHRKECRQIQQYYNLEYKMNNCNSS